MLRLAQEILADDRLMHEDSLLKMEDTENKILEIACSHLISGNASRINVAIVARKRRKEDVGVNKQLVPVLSGIALTTYLIAENFVGRVSRDCEQTNSMQPTPESAETSLLSRVIAYAHLQFALARNILKLRREVDVLVFHVGNDLVLPIIIGKLVGKKVLLVITGSLSITLSSKRGDRSAFQIALAIIERIGFRISDKLIAYTPSCATFFYLEKFSDKVAIAHEHFLDLDKFKPLRRLEERECIVSFVGRLSEEKGITKFIESASLVHQAGEDVKFLIIGDGPRADAARNLVRKRNLGGVLTIAGRMDHDQIPSHMNIPRLIVLPSETEGLPNVLIEAMACGTPVLATPVGGIPDLIIHENTGFIIDDCSPEGLAKAIIIAIHNPNLQAIADEARKMVEKEFSYEKATSGWKAVLESVLC
ncbi:MAG: glycosyltransferase family 1 protein [Candidatus Thorarchaeota archaeon]|nr:MAG: glycosyltransferase family 1 protein [Candidatus Thorarchaeota archaeon]